MKHGVLCDPGWRKSDEGHLLLRKILEPSRNRRKKFGLLECPNLPASVPTLSYKLFVCGRSGAGKTATVLRLCGVDQPEIPCETGGAEISLVHWPLKIQGKASLFRLELWDAGDVAAKKYAHISQACKVGLDGIVFVFSLADRRSFEELPRLMSKFTEPEQKPVVAVIGTRLDSVRQEVRISEIQEFEKKYGIPAFLIENKDISDLEQELDAVSPVLNFICEQLWIRDQDKFLVS